MSKFKESDSKELGLFFTSLAKSDRWLATMFEQGHILTSMDELKVHLSNFQSISAITDVNVIIADSFDSEGIKKLKRRFSKFKYERTRPVARIHHDTFMKLERIKANAGLDSLDEAIDCLLDPDNFIARSALKLQLNEGYSNMRYDNAGDFTTVYWQELMNNVSPEAKEVVEHAVRQSIKAGYIKGLERRLHKPEHLDELYDSNVFIQILKGAELPEDEG